jgi:hypothetical protein
MKSDTDFAFEAQAEIIEVYMAWRQGKMAPGGDGTPWDSASGGTGGHGPAIVEVLQGMSVPPTF